MTSIAIATYEYQPVTDPGFPKGDANSRDEVSPYYSAKMSRKLHENEEILTAGVGGGVHVRNLLM